MGATWTPPSWFWYGTETRYKWQERFIWWPKRSTDSGQWIWWTKAWYGYRWIEGPAGEEPLKAECWLTDKEYMWFCLTQA